MAPGPLAAQLAMALGWVRGGWLGATVVGVAFVLPSFVMVLALSAVYVRFHGVAGMQATFYGVGAAVIAIIARSAVKLTKMFVDAVAVAMITPRAGGHHRGIHRLSRGRPPRRDPGRHRRLPSLLAGRDRRRSWYERPARYDGVAGFVAGITAAATGAIAGAVFILGRRSIIDLPNWCS